MSEEELPPYESNNEEKNNMEVAKEEPFTLLQIHSTDEQFSDNVERVKLYSHGQYNCVNLSLVLLGIIDKEDVNKYLDICTQRNAITMEHETSLILAWSLNQAQYDFKGVLESILIFNISGNTETFKEVMGTMAGIYGFLRDNYSTPVMIEWNDGSGHMVILRKGGIHLGTAIVEPQVEEGKAFPFLIGVFDNYDEEQIKYINKIKTIYFLRGPAISEYENRLIKVSPGGELLMNIREGGRRRIRQRKQKTRRSKRKGLKSVRRKTIRGSSL